jgi:hypothetical protein
MLHRNDVINFVGQQEGELCREQTVLTALPGTALNQAPQCGWN